MKIGQRKPGARDATGPWIGRYWSNEAQGYTRANAPPKTDGMTKLDAKGTFPPPGYVHFFEEESLSDIIAAGARVFFRSKPGARKNDYAVIEWAKVIFDALSPMHRSKLFGPAVAACVRNRETRAALLTVATLGNEEAVRRYVEAIVSLSRPT